MSLPRVKSYSDDILYYSYSLLREMADSMRKWNTYFTDRTEAIQFTAEQNGSFAFLYDYPVLQYWKGNGNVHISYCFIEHVLLVIFGF